MNLKKKLGMGIMSAVLGASLIGGGTVAYFSDSVESNNTFATGTLKLGVKPDAEFVQVKDLKPGDTMMRQFKLVNNGTLAIQNVNLLTDYNVVDADGDNGEQNLAEHIKVKFLWNWDKQSQPVLETTLADLKDDIKDLVAADADAPLWAEQGGLKPGKKDTLWVEFEFVDNGEDQNVFQGDQLDLKWTFEATQTPGEEK